MFSRYLAHLAARHGWRAGATAFGLGALSAAALPPVFAVPVLWLTIPGLLAMLGAAAGWRSAAWRGLFFGWGFCVAGLYWITYALLTDVASWWWLVPLAVPALSLPLGAFLVLPALVAWAARPGWARVLGFACAWTVAEMVRGVAFTGFPWNLIGTVWAFDAVPLQGVALVGVHGLGLATIVLAALPILGLRPFLAGGLGLLLVLTAGAARLWQAEPPPLPVSLVIVQANIPQEAKWREDRRWPNFRTHLEMTRDGIAAVPPGTRPVAIWPETASPFLLASDPEARRLAVESLPEDGLLLAGSVRAEFDAGGQLSALFNSLVAVDAQAEVVGVYDKAHLVPFGEYMPLRGILPIRLVHGARDFSAGPGPVALPLPSLPAAGVLVCYEVIFPGAVVGAVRPGWLLNVTNDGWFGISAGPHQHLAAARLRAVEEGLPLVRAAQTGISAVFDARGRVVGRLGLGEAGLLIAPLPQALPPTVFARAGIIAPGVLLLLGSALGLWLHRRARPQANTKKEISRMS
ncbi:apolipoprotein N-acyltransferase [Humitalea rosea]|uniref:Apolipoprotein N-acyltransferase n=1 Tax=Humitalea rosea TaxID=990373 RepID=A0A2W7II57_9PROT|nr:apolipoprotein N-acyltransferase [Humitalea rosea]PZW45660.1 apolipoprotein N-acyltransferase [Humitalea rosea]